MTAFKKLKTIMEYEKARMSHLRANEDFDIVIEIGYHEDIGNALTLKRLLLLEIASIATVQRRVSQLVETGILLRNRCEHDRRSIELGVSESTRKLVERYLRMMQRQYMATTTKL